MRFIKLISTLTALYVLCLLWSCNDTEESTDNESMATPEGGIVASNGGTIPTPEGGTMDSDMNPDDESMTDMSTDETCPSGQERTDGTCVPTDLEEVLPPEVIEQLVGTYAIQMQIVMIMDVPILGELDNISRVLGLTEIRADGNGGVEMIEQGCGARSDAGDTISVVIPAAIPQSIEAPLTPLTVWTEGDVIHWNRPQVVAPIGIRLEDPINDPLPMDAEDPRIWDQDNDGAPGVTVNVMGFATGDLHIIQKQISSMHGVLNEAGDLEGFVVDNSEQYTIGSTNPLLNQQIPSRPNPDRSLSTLRSVRMTEAVDCDWLLENQADVFPSDD